MKLFRSISVLLCAAALSACEQNAVQEITDAVSGDARVRFFNFGVNAPAVNFYGNDVKLTAILSATGTPSTTGTGYGGVAAGGFYSAVEPGQYALQARISGATDQGLAISNLAATIEDDTHYSFFLSGFYDTVAKTVDSFIVEDAFIEEIDYTSAYVRFVHAISNAQPMTLYATNTTTGAETAIGGAVAYKGASAFTALPEGVYNLAARYAGSTTSAISRAAVSFEEGTVYTIGARGDITVTSTTAATRPFLDNTANR
jgi:hypothetical protein